MEETTNYYKEFKWEKIDKPHIGLGEVEKLFENLKEKPQIKVHIPDIIDPAEANICDGCE